MTLYTPISRSIDRERARVHVHDDDLDIVNKSWSLIVLYAVHVRPYRHPPGQGRVGRFNAFASTFTNGKKPGQSSKLLASLQDCS